MFDGFELTTIDTGEATIRLRRGGDGPPLLLLHGHPQTHAMWNAVAPRLAGEHTVVAADLRGYGESSKPPTSDDHEPYSKRAMARDMVAVMEKLGFERFGVCGHDRGGRVAYRLALDHPERVSKVAVLDIVPTAEMWRRADKEFGLVDWHWFFLAQRWFDVLQVWRRWARDVRGRAIDCGHFLAEEAPHEVYAELRAFFA
jgi:haloacetate dehalogenase